MNRLNVKSIDMQLDDRDSNLNERNGSDNPTKFKQSEYTCQIVFVDKAENEYGWVAKYEDLAKAIELISENEDKKYDVENKPWVLGRNMFFLSWLYKIWQTYLNKYGFKPPEKDLELAKKHKRGKEF